MATPEDFARIGNYALMYNADSNIDRHKCTRTVPMEVLSLGFSRTGTLTMQRAFQILGYPNPYHFSSVYGNVKDCDMWREAFDAKYRGKGKFGRAEFHKLLGHCGATTDAPCMVFWKELAEAYPDAKVILVEREEESWFKSWDLLMQNAFEPFGALISYTDPFWLGRINGMGYQWIRDQVGASNLQQARANSRSAYRKHYADIRRTIPKERVLEYELGSGWEPLCKFLGKDVPDVPFPHLNEGQTISLVFKEMAQRAVTNSLWNIATVLGVGAVIGGFAWSFFR